MLKRKTDGSEDEVVSYDSKKQKIDIPMSEQVLMSTIPYHSLSYSEQVCNFSLLLMFSCLSHLILEMFGCSNWSNDLIHVSGLFNTSHVMRILKIMLCLDTLKLNCSVQDEPKKPYKFFVKALDDQFLSFVVYSMNW